LEFVEMEGNPPPPKTEDEKWIDIIGDGSFYLLVKFNE
jgi:hypothetical protein